jgi:hypothetical protein
LTKGELACVAKVLKNNPEYTAVISLYHLNNEKELTGSDSMKKIESQLIQKRYMK